jgi:hypothetical protein
MKSAHVGQAICGVATPAIAAKLGFVKRRIAFLFAILSALYLLVMGLTPDPVPIIDEAAALMILIKSTAYLGYDIRRWLPFFRKHGKSSPSGQTVDV